MSLTESNIVPFCYSNNQGELEKIVMNSKKLNTLHQLTRALSGAARIYLAPLDT